MLGRGGKAVPRRKVSPWKPRVLAAAIWRCDPGVLAGALDDASPARIARHVEHRREGQGDAILRRLLGGDARRFLPKVGSEQAGFRQGDGKNRAVAMDDVEAHEQGDAEAGFLHRETLDRARLVGAPEVEQVADPPGPNPLLQVAKLAGAGDHAGRRDHVELPDLFLERHRREQCIDASHALALSSRDEPMVRSADHVRSKSALRKHRPPMQQSTLSREYPRRRRGRIMREWEPQGKGRFDGGTIQKNHTRRGGEDRRALAEKSRSPMSSGWLRLSGFRVSATSS